MGYLAGHGIDYICCPNLYTFEELYYTSKVVMSQGPTSFVASNLLISS